MNHDPALASTAPGLRDPLRPVTSYRHTLVLLAIVFGVAALGSQRAAKVEAGAPASHVSTYLALLVSEWALFGFAVRGLRRARTPLAEVLGEVPRRPAVVLRTVALAALLRLVAPPLLEQVRHGLDALDPRHVDEAARTLQLVAPHGATEVALWIALSISAGICEEFVFRGVLQRQCIALTRAPLIGIALAAIAFGLAHAYQGPKSVVAITVFGVLFGLLAHFSRSLAPGMLAHAWQDIAGGLGG